MHLPAFLFIVGLAVFLVLCLILGLVRRVARLVVVCLALVLIYSLVDCLVGGVALLVVLVLVAMTVAVAAVVGVRGCGTEADDCRNEDGR